MKAGDLVKVAHSWAWKVMEGQAWTKAEEIGLVIEAKIMRPVVVLWVGKAKTTLHHPKTIEVIHESR